MASAVRHAKPFPAGLGPAPVVAGGFNLGSSEQFEIARCRRCQRLSVWIDGAMVHPQIITAPLPNPDLSDDVRRDFEEARAILSLSPRGAAALLRLAIQKICTELGESGTNINQDIGSLVKKGLPLKVQQALDTVRVVGNNTATFTCRWFFKAMRIIARWTSPPSGLG